MIIVGGTAKIFKLNAGAPSALPTLVHTLDLDAADGTRAYGLVLDTAKGYGTSLERATGNLKNGGHALERRDL